MSKHDYTKRTELTWRMICQTKHKSRIACKLLPRNLFQFEQKVFPHTTQRSSVKTNYFTKYKLAKTVNTGNLGIDSSNYELIMKKKKIKLILTATYSPEDTCMFYYLKAHIPLSFKNL